MIVLGIGFGKCGTTAIGKLFLRSKNFVYLRKSDKGLEIGDEIWEKEIDGSQNYFAKNPRWIRKDEELQKLKEKFGSDLRVIINIRHPMEYLQSMYNMRLRSHPKVFEKIKFGGFLAMPMMGTKDVTYLKSALNMKERVQSAVEIFGKDNVVFIEHGEMCTTNPVQLLANQGIELGFKNNKFVPYDSYTKADPSLFNEKQVASLTTAWEELKQFVESSK